MAAGVVGDHAVAGALQRRRAHHDVAAAWRSARAAARPAAPRRCRRPPAGTPSRSITDSLIPLSTRSPWLPSSTSHGRHRRHLPDRGPRPLRDAPRRRRLLGRMVRPLPPARARDREAVAARDGKVELAKVDVDANPGVARTLPDPEHPRRQGVQGRRRSSPSSSAPSRRPPSTSSWTRCCPPRPTGSSRSATRSHCAGPSSWSPPAPTRPCRWRGCCSPAATPTGRWRSCARCPAASPPTG